MSFKNLELAADLRVYVAWCKGWRVNDVGISSGVCPLYRQFPPIIVILHQQKPRGLLSGHPRDKPVGRRPLEAVSLAAKRDESLPSQDRSIAVFRCRVRQEPTDR